MPIWYLKMRLTETFPTLPCDVDLAVGVRRTEKDVKKNVRTLASDAEE